MNFDYFAVKKYIFIQTSRWITDEYSVINVLVGMGNVIFVYHFIFFCFSGGVAVVR